MKLKEILVFGATGQIGKHLIRKLTKSNYKVTAVTRNIHRKGYILKTQSNSGYLEIIELRSFDVEKIQSLMKNCSICINLIGILFEKKENQFNNIHTNFPDLLSKLSNRSNIEQLIHISSLGIDEALDSKYAISKIEGEKVVRKNFKNYIILKPSIVYSVDDNFTTNLMSLLSLLPIFPLYYNGNTKFSPLHVSDFCEIILKVIENNILAEVIECVGPEELSFKQILKKLLKSINKNTILIPFPLKIAKIVAILFEMFPKPLITKDQLRLLRYDNVLSKENKSNIDFGIKANLKFEEEILKYSYMWKSGGQYSK